jgi:competence protein ComEC
LKTWRWERLLLIALAATVGLSWRYVWQSSNRLLLVTFLDVGEGDAAVVRAPSGLTILIDGGGEAGPQPGPGDAGDNVIVPALLMFGAPRLDAVVLTHADEDHVGGLDSVLREIPSRLIVVPGLAADTDSYEDFREQVRRLRVPVHRARPGQMFRLGDGITARVLHPASTLIAGTGSDSNNNSVVLRLVYDQVSFLMPGDLEREGEQVLLDSRTALRSTVLKVAHHGSDTGTGPAFLKAVRPDLAVISVGRDNPFGHPSPSTVARLRRAGAAVMRTDINGAITVKTSGKWWKVEASGRRTR